MICNIQSYMCLYIISWSRRYQFEEVRAERVAGMSNPKTSAVSHRVFLRSSRAPSPHRVPERVKNVRDRPDSVE